MAKGELVRRRKHTTKASGRKFSFGRDNVELSYRKNQYSTNSTLKHYRFETDEAIYAHTNLPKEARQEKVRKMLKAARAVNQIFEKNFPKIPKPIRTILTNWVGQTVYDPVWGAFSLVEEVEVEEVDAELERFQSEQEWE